LVAVEENEGIGGVGAAYDLFDDLSRGIQGLGKVEVHPVKGLHTSRENRPCCSRTRFGLGRTG